MPVLNFTATLASPFNTVGCLLSFVFFLIITAGRVRLRRIVLSLCDYLYILLQFGRIFRGLNLS